MQKENFKFALSFHNVQSMPLDKYEKNFEFIVNGKQYKTSRYVADLLSPIIRKYHYIDETINRFTIENFQQEAENSQSSSNKEDYFTDFLKLTEFNSNMINETQRNHYINYFIQLGNIEEYFRLYPQIKEEENPDSIIDRLEFLIKSIQFQNNIKETFISNSNIENMISFISSHFSEISNLKMKKLPIEIIAAILNHESFKIEEEDDLLNFILELYEEDKKYSFLFEYIKFENISEEGLSKFVEKFNIDDLNNSIWRSICKRILPSKQTSLQNERYIISAKEFKHDSNNELHGIMRYLSDETKGNIHDNGTVEITANLIRGNDHPKNLVDYESDNYYYSKNCRNENAIIYFDFKDKLVQPTNYSIKSYTGCDTSGHLKNWVVEVSNDKVSWEVVDKHENDSSLRTPGAIVTFNMNKVEKFYRFIRLRQTGESWYGNGGYCNIYFHFIEFYGKLKEPK